MSHTSPASYLVWSIISILLGIFLVFHLWSFDRFRCLKWNNGPHSGAFKRVMTYSYLLSVPLIITYATGFAVIKYQEGFISFPTLGVIPKPYQLWTPEHQSAIFPLTLMFSAAWALEMVTHLEELCFWFFLVNAGSHEQDWFTSYYFRSWVFGSLIAVTYMPLVTILTRGDHLQSEAYSFLAGSLGSLCLTLWFIPILWMFPRFLHTLREEDVDVGTIVRLTKFAELNQIRILFRFMFVIPLLILGIDGVRPHNHINESMFWTDFFAVVAGFGCAISSGITLTIFFPRSIEGEISRRDARKERKCGRSPHHSTASNELQNPAVHSRTGSEAGGTYLLTSSPIKPDHAWSLDMKLSADQLAVEDRNGSVYSIVDSATGTKGWASGEYPADSDDGAHSLSVAPVEMTQLPVSRSLRPNRRRGDDVELGGFDGLTVANLSRFNSKYKGTGFGAIGAGAPVNSRPINNFTSPIDFVYRSGGDIASQTNNSSRLTFTRRGHL